ncbi:conserved hypothetical protein [Ricinus communis]|uniref:Reverse transcriptase domain-containing protein n=1 Tax=Ricinus communis TaxID=3988 RepID=B9SL42_RICCO|nr:conserved hypothetical protein [Ricinus communis]
MDNVMIAFEMLHYMKRKSNNKRGEVALNLDVSKAYDNMDWNFFIEYDDETSFRSPIIGLMMITIDIVLALRIKIIWFSECWDGPRLVGPRRYPFQNCGQVQTRKKEGSTALRHMY